MVGRRGWLVRNPSTLGHLIANWRYFHQSFGRRDLWLNQMTSATIKLFLPQGEAKSLQTGLSARSHIGRRPPE